MPFEQSGSGFVRAQVTGLYGFRFACRQPPLLARFFGGLVGPFWCLAGDFYKPDDRHLRLTVTRRADFTRPVHRTEGKTYDFIAGAEVYPVNI